jgi:hypothetical protein
MPLALDELLIRAAVPADVTLGLQCDTTEVRGTTDTASPATRLPRPLVADCQCSKTKYCLCRCDPWIARLDCARKFFYWASSQFFRSSANRGVSKFFTEYFFKTVGTSSAIRSRTCFLISVSVVRILSKSNMTSRYSFLSFLIKRMRCFRLRSASWHMRTTTMPVNPTP